MDSYRYTYIHIYIYMYDHVYRCIMDTPAQAQQGNVQRSRHEKGQRIKRQEKTERNDSQSNQDNHEPTNKKKDWTSKQSIIRMSSGYVYSTE